MTLVLRPKLALRDNFIWDTSIWNPSMITTALWLDAEDASTVTTVSGAVSQWNDKSGTNKYASQSTTANRPTYSSISKEIVFDGSNDSLQLSRPYGAASQNGLTFYTVCSAPGNFVVIGTADLTNLGYKGIAQLRPADGSTAAGTSFQSGVTDANRHVFGMTQSDTSIKSYTDGTIISNLTGPRSLYRYDGTQYLARGDGSTGSTVWAGAINEVIVANYAATDSTRQRIEGYLAHKWGLTANLPSSHPYKTVGPTP
jgi:hypothetical protein